MAKLTKPAQIGCTVYEAGVDERLVIERAQREFEFKSQEKPRLYSCSQNVLIELMIETGVVKKEIETKIMGKTNSSRGYYIVTSDSGVWYLHHDGIIRCGVNAKAEKPAFWETKEEAEKFFSEWKATKENQK